MAPNEPSQTSTGAGRFVVLSDSPSLDGDDDLDFEVMAGQLERIIVASRKSAPFTASIEAGWGAGKSTLMRRLKRRLEDGAPGGDGPLADVRTVWFNAWTAPESKVLEGLVRSVLEELDTNVLRRAARNRKLLRGLGIGASLAAGLLGVGNLVDRIWQKTSIDPKQRNELNEFVREAMDAWLNKASTPGDRLIVVFIDDLDRCTATTVMQVFEAMKLYLDAPGFVFVVGWDTEQVLRAVATEKGGEDRLPQRYVEKIVQFGFRIPRPSEDQLDRLAGTLCVASGLTEQVLAVDHRRLLINTTNGNPRQLKRFINRFILLYERAGETADAEVLIQLMVMQASYDNFYRLLANVPGDDDADNPLFEFADYLEARTAVGRGQPLRVVEVLHKRGYDSIPDTAVAQFDAFERNLPRDYPPLVEDAQFVQLVVAMSDEVKRELRRLARSDDVQPVDPVTLSGTTKTAPTFDPAAVAAPGTTVLWIDDKPNPEDHALLPAGVNLIQATSIDQARRLLEGRTDPITLLISDVGREHRRDAGLEDLRRLREEGLYNGPAVFYTVRPTTGQVEEASRLSADMTSSPTDLQAIVQRYLPLAPPPTPTARLTSSAPS